MLDEMDKLGQSFHGDPSAALLEVLDPEQNGTFRDNYLAVPFDLSRVMFIGTANVLDQIPGPLRDRMEVIELPGYTEDEKVEIAKRYLITRQLEATGLTPEQVEITEDAIRAIIRDYTREAGVRNLERELGSILHHVAMRVAEGNTDRMRIGAEQLHAILGPRHFESEVAMRTSVPGVATGLAWTPTGGDILFVEAARVPGSGRLILTGQLGDVMKESAQAALSLAKARASSLGVDPTSVREVRHPRARAGRRHPQGRPERGRRHVHRARLVAHRTHRAKRHGDDRRDLAARAGAADRRRQEQGAGRGARRDHHRAVARAQQEGLRGRARGRPHGRAVRLAVHGRRRGRGRP